MNKQRVSDLVSQMKLQIELLQTELAANSYPRYNYNPHLYEEIKLFEEWWSEIDDDILN